MTTSEQKLQALLASRGAKLAEPAIRDKAFGHELGETLDAIERTKISALWMLLELRRMYPDLSVFPEPDSGKEEGTEGNNTDWYKEDDDSPKRSMLNDFADSLPRGRECVEHLQQIRKARGGKKASARYAGMPNRTLDSHKQTWQQRQTAVRNMLRKALRIQLQLNRFKEDLPEIKVDLYLADGKLTETPTPVIINDVNDPVRYRLVSVSTFLGYNVDEILKDGGTWHAIFTANQTEEEEEEETEEDDSSILEDYRQRQSALLDIIDDSEGQGGQSAYNQDPEKWLPEITKLCGNDPMLRRMVCLIVGKEEDEIFDLELEPAA